MARGYAQLENCQRSARVDLRPLQDFLHRVQRELGLGRESVFIRFVTDAEMARLNLRFRKKKGTTDVLSFPSEERRPPGRSRRAGRGSRDAFLGDIAISLRTARRNARLLGRTLPGELRILILHGVLHLLGYDHETDQGEMDRVETRLRRRLGLVA